ncbi:MAG TPA: Crp/Fnr family transcriptional regulator [Caulobacteraceae bacterium]|nr:Crp/Fnr family transcriptional regulator [Caulobacteraceae bacterium]
MDARTESLFANRLLKAMPPPSLERLQAHFEPVELTRRQVLYSSGERADAIYFVGRGLVSLVKPMQDGRSMEVSVVGAEGAVCLSSILGLGEALLDSVVHIPGHAVRIKSAVFREELGRDGAVRDLAMRYAELTLGQLSQTSACNGLHRLDQRCCRWLLTAHDNAGADTFPLTHEFLALMLGVQRPGVTLAAGALQKAGLIAYRNGQVSILDRAGLEGCACECYGAMRGLQERLFGPA